MSEIDWASLQQDAKDVLLQDGDYVCIVSKAEAVTASTGRPMMKLQLTIAEGPKRDRKLFTQIVLSTDNPFALQRWFANMACFGLDAAYFGTKPSMEKIATDLMNRGVIAVVGHHTWQGSERNDVQNYRPFAPTGPVPPGMILGPVGSGPSVPAATAPSPTAPAPSVPSTPPSAASKAPSTPPPARPF